MLRGGLSIEIARYKSFARLMPVFYFCFLFLLASKIYVFGGTVPWVLGYALPLALSVYAVVRGHQWVKVRNQIVTQDDAVQGLKHAARLLHVMYPIIVAYDFALYAYGSSDQRMVTILHLILTPLAMLGFMVHLRTSARLFVATGVVPTMMLVLLTQEQDISYAIVLSFAMIVVTIATIMQIHFDEFEEFIRTQLSLERLGNENLRLACTDVVTSLPNRREFFRKVCEELANAKAYDAEFSIGIIDLDGFKAVNDTHGHKVGDIVLAEVARRLLAIEGDNVSFHRLGGDEFAFIVSGSASEGELMALGQMVIDRVSLPIKCGTFAAAVGCSVGIASFPAAAQEADLLFEYCDFALYEAKRNGRLRTEIFSQKHQTRMVEQNAVEHALRSADFEAEIYPEFQPITDTVSGSTVAMECLARWNSPKLGHVSPAEFIPAAEQWGLIASVTKVMIRKVLVVAAAWPQHVKISINLSPHDIMSDERVAEILAIVKESGVPYDRLVFELTETAFIKNFEVAHAHIEVLRASGAAVALDDFGAGYSSLSHVQALPLDKIKVDRRFIKDIERNETSQCIIRHVFSLCKSLRIECVVEGVETTGQLEALKSLGCEHVQGYLFSRPMGAELVADYLMAEAEARVREAKASEAKAAGSDMATDGSMEGETLVA